MDRRQFIKKSLSAMGGFVVGKQLFGTVSKLWASSSDNSESVKIGESVHQKSGIPTYWVHEDDATHQKPKFKMVTFDLKELKAKRRIPQNYTMDDFTNNKTLLNELAQEYRMNRLENNGGIKNVRV